MRRAARRTASATASGRCAGNSRGALAMPSPPTYLSMYPRISPGPPPAGPAERSGRSMADTSSRRPAAQSHLDVEEIGSERLEDRAGARCVFRTDEERPGGGQVLDDLDADGGTAKTRLDDVGTVESHIVGRRRSGPAGARSGGPAATITPPKASLSMPERGRRHPRAGVRNPGQVERRLQRPILAGPTVTTHDGDLECRVVFCLREAATGRHSNPPPAPSTRRRACAPLRHAVDKCRRFERGIDGEPLGRLRPVERLHGVTGALAARGLLGVRSGH